jgi:hypothetical protein
MPRVSGEKQKIIKDGLEAGLDVEEVRKLAVVSPVTVYRMRLSLELFGTLYPPTYGTIGRPRTFTSEEEEVGAPCAMVLLF